MQFALLSSYMAVFQSIGYINTSKTYEMKPKTKITEQDYITAMKRANRELEIAMFGKQVSMRGGVKHKSKKTYDRNRIKREVLV